MMAEAADPGGTSRVDLAATADFDLGDLRIRPARRQVCAPDGACRELEPRVMQVLVALASARPEVVSRDRLIETCWNGRIVGDDAINRCIVALRHLAREVSPAPFAIGTVPRVGYYLVETLSDRPEASDAGAPDAHPAFASVPPGFLRPVLTALVIGLLLVAAFAFVRFGRGGTEAAPASIAVLPFRNLSSGDPYFAEGVAEEIRGQLARDPQFRVAGRTSSGELRNAVDLRGVGRRLGVSYVLEGSVRSAGGRVRVNAALVQTRDGMQLWSDSFDGTLDDIFAIQQRIGAATATALRRRLAAAPASYARARVTSGEVYSLYLSARGLLRERNPQAIGAARVKLVRAVALDPQFAPAWSSLAQIELGFGWADGPGREAAARRARAAARRALVLAPDLAEAHAVLGLVAGLDHPAAAGHVGRAAALDPASAEYRLWLGHVRYYRADFRAALRDYRRALAIDPLWPTAQKAAVEMAWEMGHAGEALGYVRRIERDGNRYQAHMIRADLAAVRGDFSGQASEIAAAAAATDDAGRRTVAQCRRGLTFRNLGLHRRASGIFDSAAAGGLPCPGSDFIVIRQGALPTLAELTSRNRNIPYRLHDLNYVEIAAKLLINAGRARDVVRLYDSEDGILGLSRHSPPAAPARIFEDVPLVAAALRAVGRGAEADRILAHVDRLASEALRRSGGTAPPWFLAGTAQLWAMRGKDEAALSALERAMANGWAYATAWDDASLRDIGDEPAFRSLRGHPRFERIRERLRRHLERERRELADQPV